MDPTKGLPPYASVLVKHGSVDSRDNDEEKRSKLLRHLGNGCEAINRAPVQPGQNISSYSSFPGAPMPTPLLQTSNFPSGFGSELPLPSVLRANASLHSLGFGSPTNASMTSTGHPLIGQSMFSTPIHGCFSTSDRGNDSSSTLAILLPVSESMSASSLGIDSTLLQCADYTRSPDDFHLEHQIQSITAASLLDLTPSLSHQEFQTFVEISENHSASRPTSNSRLLSKRDSILSTDIQKEKRQRPFTCADAIAHAATENTGIAIRSRRLFEQVPKTVKPCKCKNTHCLKLYCTCFQKGSFCDPDICKCIDCYNLREFNETGGKRQEAVSEILLRRIDAFESRPKKKTGEGCACKKNRCLQKYCDCFATKSDCTERCRCSAACGNNRFPAIEDNLSNEEPPSP